MATAKDREFLTVSSEAHAHLKAVVERYKKNGVPMNGTLLASQIILSIPMPEITAKESKRRTSKAATVPPVVAMPAA